MVKEMVSGVNSGNLYASAEARVAAKRQKQLSQMYGFNIDMASALWFSSGGKQEAVINQIATELNIDKTPTEDNLSFDRYVASDNDSNNLLFQGQDDNLYNLNFTEGTYDTQSEDEFVKENYANLINPEDESDKAYDVLEFGQNSAEFVNYAFTGTGDGTDSLEISIDNFASNAGGVLWGDNMNFVYQEVNVENPTTSADIYTYNNFVSSVVKNSTNWIGESEALAIQKSEGYDAFLKKLIDKAIAAMQNNDNFIVDDTEETEETEDAENDE